MAMAMSNLDEMESGIIDGVIPKNRRQPSLSTMQKWKAKVEEFNSLAPPEGYIMRAKG